MFRKFLLTLLLVKCATGAEINSQRETINTCGGDYSGYKYTITSPNYPHNYPDNIECIYVLRGSPRAKCDQIFNLQFLDFSLKSSDNCQGDFVEIGDRSLFCESVRGIRRYSGKDNSLRIRFHSGERGNRSVGRGFKIAVTTLPCPLANDNSSVFHSSRFNQNHEDDSIPEVEPLTDEPPSVPEQSAANQIYPVYRPHSPFTSEESIVSPKTLPSPGSAIPSVIPLETSGAHAQLFPDNSLENPHPEKPVNSNFLRPVKISSYFFSAPDSEAAPNHQKSSQYLSEQPPPALRVIPLFRDSQTAQLPSKSQESEAFSPPESSLSKLEDFKLTDKIGVPATTYGLPGSITHPHISNLKPGEVLDTTRDVDCYGKVNANGFQRPAQGNYNPPNVFAPAGSYPGVTYGQPDPPFLSPSNPARLPPTRYLPSPPRPGGFIPTQNPGSYFPGIAPRLVQCCGNLFSGQRFLLSSPGFPTLLYNGNSYECAYSIAPQSQDVCRLRLNFKFFNLGTDDTFCGNGHLEIDGRRYCGCRTGLSVVSEVPNLVLKTIGVRYTGLPKTKLNGFVIEVIQESCGYPVLARSKKEAGNGTFVHEDHEDRNGTAVRAKRNLGYSYPKPAIPFDQPVGQVGQVGHLGFTSSSRCQALSLIDWTLAAKEVYLKGVRCTSGGGTRVPDYPNYPGGYFPPNYPGNGNGIPGYPGGNLPPNYPGSGLPNYPGGGNILPGYPDIPNGLPSYPTNGNPGGAPGYPPSNGIPPNSGNCETVSVLEGILSSPFYPNPYPNNVNMCWRFYRSPIGCRLQLSFLDFEVESSPGCVKDYISISGQNTRFCGRTLAGSKTLLGFPTSNFIDIRFSSDGFGTGKGFTIAFTQIPCQVEANR